MTFQEFLSQQRYVVIDADTKSPVKNWKKTTLTSHDVANEDDVAVVIPAGYTVLDFDDRDYKGKPVFDTIIKIIKAKNISCYAMKSNRGGHIWFRDDDGKKKQVGVKTAITYKCDILSHLAPTTSTIREDGVDRKKAKFGTKDELDFIPKWLLPMDSAYDFDGMTDGDGRNSAYSRYVFLLLKKMQMDDVKETIRIINDYVVRDSLGDDEMDVILRDDTFKDVLEKVFWDENRFLHANMGEYLLDNEQIGYYNDQLFIYNGMNYRKDTRLLKRKIQDLAPTAKESHRREVLHYLDIYAETLEPSPYHYVSTLNGILDIKKKKVEQHSPTFFKLNTIDAKYDPNAYDEIIDKMLDRVTCNDKKMRECLEEMIGYCIIDTAKYQKAFMLIGEGSNGKSVFVHMLENFIGKHNASALSLKDLHDKFRAAEIVGKLININDDLSASYLKETDTFKALVTGGTVTLEEKGRDPFSHNSTTTIVFNANEIPRASDKTAGFLRRFIFLPFDAKFKATDSDFNPDIFDDVISPKAKSYLLNLALQGIARLEKNKSFTICDRSLEMMDEYVLENNNVFAFLNENPIQMFINDPVNSVFNDYRSWCQESNRKPMSVIQFKKELVKKAKLVEKRKNRVMVQYVGGVKDE